MFVDNERDIFLPFPNFVMIFDRHCARNTRQRMARRANERCESEIALI